MIGDGSSLPITHTGSTSFTTHNTSFKLDNILYVLSMRKNLISISQFCTSNNVSVEFLPSSFHVKELRTGTILLKGHTKDGVYEWSVSSSPTALLVAFSSVKTSSYEWHYRLGHPTFSHFKTHCFALSVRLVFLSYLWFFCVMLATTIKAINYLSLHLLLSPLNHLKLFSLMCGLPLLSPITFWILFHICWSLN